MLEVTQMKDLSRFAGNYRLHEIEGRRWIIWDNVMLEGIRKCQELGQGHKRTAGKFINEETMKYIIKMSEKRKLEYETNRKFISNERKKRFNGTKKEW